VFLVKLDVVEHVFHAVLDELNGPIALPIAAEPVLSSTDASFN